MLLMQEGKLVVKHFLQYSWKGSVMKGKYNPRGKWYKKTTLQIITSLKFLWFAPFDDI